jgi:hypothetical protein
MTYIHCNLTMSARAWVLQTLSLSHSMMTLVLPLRTSVLTTMANAPSLATEKFRGPAVCPARPWPTMALCSSWSQGTSGTDWSMPLRRDPGSGTPWSPRPWRRTTLTMDHGGDHEQGLVLVHAGHVSLRPTLQPGLGLSPPSLAAWAWLAVLSALVCSFVGLCVCMSRFELWPIRAQILFVCLCVVLFVFVWFTHWVCLFVCPLFVFFINF